MSLSTAYPACIQGLTTREAIIDTLYRACIAFDTNDWELYKSVWVNSPSTSFVVGEHMQMVGMDAINNILERVGHLATTHMVSNPRVQIADDGKTARLTAHVLAQHFGQGKGLEQDAKFLLGGTMYDIDLVHDDTDGLWKATTMRVNLIWRQGDPSVVS